MTWREARCYLDGVTQQNTAQVEQVAAAAESLSHEAQNLSSAASLFKLDGSAGVSRQAVHHERAGPIEPSANSKAKLPSPKNVANKLIALPSA